MKKFQFQDCFMEADESRLILGNSRIRRTLDLTAGMPKTVSFRDAAGTRRRKTSRLWD